MVNKRSSLFSVSAMVMASALMAVDCGSGDVVRSPITLSATLYSGPATEGFSTPSTPLVDYQLYCITFTHPAVDAQGTSGADGAVSLKLNVGSGALECFIRDTFGTSVATVVFTDAQGTQKSQVVSLTGVQALGAIMVDLTTGVALAMAPSDASIVTTTPAGMSCPVGIWYSDIGYNSFCNSELTSYASVAQTPDGNYILSFTTYGTSPLLSSSGICTAWSMSSMFTLWDGQMLAAVLSPNDPSCLQKQQLMGITPDEDCSSASGQLSILGVDACGGTFLDDQACGTQACDWTFTLTRL